MFKTQHKISLFNNNSTVFPKSWTEGKCWGLLEVALALEIAYRPINIPFLTAKVLFQANFLLDIKLLTTNSEKFNFVLQSLWIFLEMHAYNISLL